MNYLRITNKGLICAEDLILIGSSTKREQTGKIGMFGSGWKYALSWLLRNECNPIIYSGENKIEVDFTIKMHRENPVKVITINGQQSSLTTEMGPKWSGWMALREIISNAIDEGDWNMNSEYNPEFRSEPNKTAIYIPLNTELGNVMIQFDNYFAFNRKPDFKFSYGNIFLKNEKSKLNVYRKGIRCFDGGYETMIDFDFNDININEDRLCSAWDIFAMAKKIMAENTSPNLLKIVCQESYSHQFLPNEEWNDNILNSLKSLIDSGETFTTENIRSLGGMLFSSPNSLKIPQEWYDKLRELKLIKSTFQLLGNGLKFVRTDERNLDDVHYQLGEFGIKMELQSGSCNKEAVFYNGIGYVNSETNLTSKEIAANILGTTSVDFWRERFGLSTNNKNILDLDDDYPF